ncbi:MAG: FAD-binding protein, partial [Pseudomonadota bacterium]
MALSVLNDYPLKELTSWKVGGEAQHYCAPSSRDEVWEALEWASDQGVSYTLLGGGTNVLVSDTGIAGLVIHTHQLKDVSTELRDNHWVIHAQGGALKSEVLKVFLKHRLEPAIFLAGLPGDMAGGVVMNAGVGHRGTPKDFSEIVDSFEVIWLSETGERKSETYSKEQVQWFYRKSSGWHQGVITQVTVSWPNDYDESVLERLREG